MPFVKNVRMYLYVLAKEIFFLKRSNQTPSIFAFFVGFYPTISSLWRLLLPTRAIAPFYPDILNLRNFLGTPAAPPAYQASSCGATFDKPSVCWQSPPALL